MSNWKIIRLNFGRNVAHFGELGIGMEESSERVRSDSLFSAWISAYARLFGKEAVETLLGQCKINPPFQVSSTFIYRRMGEQYTYYLPKLLALPKKYPCGSDDLDFSKTFKKLTYLPLKVWQRWYQGEGFAEGDRAELIAETNGKSQGNLRQLGTFSYKETFKIEQIPKIAVDRTTRATNLYHTGFVHFEWEAPNQSGLYFLLHLSSDDAALENQLNAALNLLGEEGMGGERSSGAGRFEVEWPKQNLKSEDPLWDEVVNFSGANGFGLISLFWELPLKESLLTDATCYGIQERGGWIASSSGQQLRRKSVRMFAEGSVFPVKPQGQLADVTPRNHSGGHSIYRSGIALSLPVKVLETPSG